MEGSEWIFHSPLYFLNAFKWLGWARPKSGVGNSTWVFQTGGRDASIWAIICCLAGWALVDILDQKWNSSHSKRNRGWPQCQLYQCTTCQTQSDNTAEGPEFLPVNKAREYIYLPSECTTFHTTWFGRFVRTWGASLSFLLGLNRKQPKIELKANTLGATFLYF